MLPSLQMLAIAFSLFAACKILSLLHAPRSGGLRLLAYLLAWPGMDSAAFLAQAAQPPSKREWLFAVAKTWFGIALLFSTRHIDDPLARGWLGMVGIVFVFHFGTFHVLSCVWRAVGWNAVPIMDWPIRSRSLAEFWGRRWNRAFRDLIHRFLFHPLCRRLGPKTALSVGFLVSGFIHELVITVPAGGGYGGPTAYFVLQAIGLFVERRLGPSRGLTALVVVVPSYFLFPPLFVERVILPLLP